MKETKSCLFSQNLHVTVRIGVGGWKTAPRLASAEGCLQLTTQEVAQRRTPRREANWLQLTTLKKPDLFRLPL
jgi:hypothetical protein